MILSRVFTTSLTFFFTFYISFISSYAQEEKVDFTKENYKKKIVDVFNGFKETENTSSIERMLLFLKRHQDLKLHDTLNSLVLYLKGVYHILSLHRYKEADNILQESIVLASKTQDKLLQGFIHNDRAVVASYINGDYEKAEVFYKKEIVCFEEIGNNYKLIETYDNLKVTSRSLYKYEEAIGHANKCLELIGDDEDLLFCIKFEKKQEKKHANNNS